MTKLLTLLETLLQSVLADFFAFSFLVGFVIFLIGLLLTGLYLLTRTLGRTCPGTVVGAIKEIRVKTKVRDGQQVEKRKETLYPVFEYARADGGLHWQRGSEGGSATLKYSTGQTVRLRVREDQEYDDVYDLDQRGALYLGVPLLGVGLVLMVQVGSVASAAGVGLLTLLAIALLRVASALTSGRRSGARSSRDSTPYNQSFDMDQVRPIEEFRAQQSRAA